MAPTPLGCSCGLVLEAKESSHLSNHKLDPKKDVKAINKAYVEHLNAWKSLLSNPKFTWFTPQSGWIMINFDVTIRPHANFTAVMGRNEPEDIIFAHSSVFPPLDPTLGKTQTTLQAIKFDVSHNLSILCSRGLQRCNWCFVKSALYKSLRFEAGPAEWWSKKCNRLRPKVKKRPPNFNQ